MRFTTAFRSSLLLLILLAIIAPTEDHFVFSAEANKKTGDQKTESLRDYVPKAGIFPPNGVGVHYAGDLVISDPINRRGGLRHEDNEQRHYFAMLPYGMVWYHGAPADIRDIPWGTHMHGRFLLSPKGEENTIPKLDEKKLRRYPLSKYNHAILLEDTVSFYSRRGRTWKVLGMEQGTGPARLLKLSVEPIGPEIEGGINKPIRFNIDPATRVWRNKGLVKMDQVKAGQEIHVNLTWGPFKSKATTDIWLDEVSLKAHSEIQRQRHIKQMRSRFLPGWVDKVKNNDTGGGEVTVTLFGGMDSSLYNDITKKRRTLKICNAETTLRTWGYHQEYSVPSEIIELKETKNPPLGSSGIQLRLRLNRMLDGFRPGRIIRIRGPWTYVLLAHDEWIMNEEALKDSKKMKLP